MKSIVHVFWIVTILQLFPLATAVCPDTAITLYAEKGAKYITSPNYPNSYGVYGTRLSCSWQILASPGYEDVVIQMQVINSSMEPATGCWRDSVEIIDGTHSFHAPLISWCGATWPSMPIVTTGSAALVTFSTNFKDNDYYGFMLAYWMAKKPITIVHTSEWTVINYVLMGLSGTLISGMIGYFSLLFLVYVIRRCQMTEDELYEKKFL